ncbi:MAG: hypothetical protein IT545_01665, partial [Rhodobacteraceae bacterium]|nr:hypothetical protein [Paracoccaceae bacterium]
MNRTAPRRCILPVTALAAAFWALALAPSALAQAFHAVPEAASAMTEAEWQAMKARAVPAERLADPAALRPRAAPLASASPPQIVPG